MKSERRKVFAFFSPGLLRRCIFSMTGDCYS